MTAPKRNPQDATLRNVRALKVRVAALEQKVKRLERWLRYMLKRLAA